MPAQNFIAKNWRGDYPLWVSYWLFGFAGNLAVAFIPSAMESAYLSFASFEPRRIFIYLALIWLCVIAISVWQWVSVWRSAGRRIAQRRLQQTWSFWPSFWPWVARGLAVLAIIQLGGALLRYGVPQSREAFSMAFLGDPSIPDYHIRVMREGREAEISGGFKYGLMRDFKATLRDNPNIRTVHLNSIGGRIGEADKLFILFRANKLDTYVARQCVSACTVAFSGGDQRVLRRGAKLGFHRGSFAGVDYDNSSTADGQRRVFLASGYAPAFIARALSTPHSKIWVPTDDELTKAGVITKISDGSDHAFSGLPFDAGRDYFADVLARSSPVYVALRDRFPDKYESLVTTYLTSFEAGQTETATIAALRGKLAAILTTLRTKADDDTLIALAGLMADQYEALHKQNAALCVRFARDGVLAGEIPNDLREREAALQAQMVQTAQTERAAATEPGTKVWNDVFDKLEAAGVKKDEVELLEKTGLTAAQEERYCTVATGLFRAAASLPAAEAGPLIRYLLDPT